jgi:hypothetical protein
MMMNTNAHRLIVHGLCFALGMQLIAGHNNTPIMHRRACGSDVHLEYNNPGAQWKAGCETEQSTAHLLELAQNHIASAVPAKHNGYTLSASE